MIKNLLAKLAAEVVHHCLLKLYVQINSRTL